MRHATNANPNNSLIPVIYNLGVMNQMLIHKGLNLGLLEEVRNLKKIDSHLIWLFHKARAFDFASAIAHGRTLLVGEGNMSFALSLAKNPKITGSRLIATTFEQRTELSDEAIANAVTLRTLGVTVLHGVDATSLHKSLGSWLFDSIVFQFPHVGSREPVEGHNPNFILVRDFLISAATQLQRGGQVLITAVDTPHYRGAFQFDESANIAGFQPPKSYSFDPKAFSGYEHTMTHQSGSALDDHNRFSTWIFRK